ncbi:MAG TPA: GNAT family protein [Blastocatellia bacterium]|nr:GNAT family protein [Blastocatellia bacterium]
MRSAFKKGSIVYIRAPRRQDRDEFIELNRASIDFYRGLASPTTTPTQFARFLSRCKQHDFEGLFVCRTEDDAIVGSVNLSQIFRGGFNSAYLGYQMGAPFAGRGYMTEAMQLVLSYAFNDLKLHRIEANIQPHNAASIALVKRAGFTNEGYSRRYLKICGRWRDHERWAILAEDWRAMKRVG